MLNGVKKPPTSTIKHRLIADRGVIVFTGNHRDMFETNVTPLKSAVKRRQFLQLFTVGSGLALSGCGGGGGSGTVKVASSAGDSAVAPAPAPSPSATPTPVTETQVLAPPLNAPNPTQLRTRPTLPTQNTIIVDLSNFDPAKPVPGWSGKAPSQTSTGKYPADRDVYIIGHKSAVWSGTAVVRGGRHVHWLGGTYSTGVWARNFVGDACVEGVLVRFPFVATGKETGDGISLTPDATTLGRSKIFILNCRVENVDGFIDGEHGDCFQLASQYDAPNGFSGVPAEVTIERFTGTTGCQGLFLANQHFDSNGYTYSCQKLTLIDVNLRKTREKLLYKNGTAKGNFVLLYLIDLNATARGDRPYPRFFENVYVEPWKGETLVDCVYPTTKEISVSSTLKTSLAPVMGLTGSTLSYPSALQVNGPVIAGAPSQGDFAPAANAAGVGALGVPGIGYASPGYAA